MPTSGDWDYTIAENAARITKYHGSAKDIVIPSTLGGYTVKWVGSGNTANNPVFDNSSLAADTTITFSNTVTAIGQYAFYGCSKIVGTLELPSSLTYIDQFAFTNCTGLTGVLTLPSRMYYIGYDAFLWCSNITKIIFKERATSQQLFIYGSAFYGCYAVTEIQFEGESYWKTSGARNPYLYSNAFAMGAYGTAYEHIVRATVYSENNMLNSALDNYKNKYTYFTYKATPVPPPVPQTLKLGSDTTVYGDLLVKDGDTDVLNTGAEITQDDEVVVKYIKLGDKDTFSSVVIESNAGLYVADKDLQTIWTEGMEIGKEDPMAGEAYILSHLPFMAMPLGSSFSKIVTLFDDLVQNDISSTSPYFSRPRAELCDTNVDTLTIEDANLAGKILSANNVGKVVPASASQVFGDAGFVEATPAGTIVEVDVPMQLSVETSQDEQEAMEG